LANSGGTELKCGDPIAYVVRDKADLVAFNNMSPDAYPKVQQSQQVAAPIKDSPKEHTPNSTTSNKPSNTRVSPAARHIIDSQSLDISGVVGTSKGGIVSKGDILLGLKNGKISSSNSNATSSKENVSIPPSTTTSTESPVNVSATTSTHVSHPPSSATNATTSLDEVSFTHSKNKDDFVDIPNTNMRKVIAKRLTESKLGIPHMYSSIECNIEELLKLRNQLKKELGVNISVNDVVIKSVALALRDVPMANAQFNAKTSTVQMNKTIDISVAVATPSGLITPIVPNADQLGVQSINTKVL
jgi:pyruvate dehydrogenase E2 component (dihydrolipoamide acetyltransferase)